MKTPEQWMAVFHNEMAADGGVTDQRFREIISDIQREALDAAAQRLESESDSVPVPDFKNDDPEKVIDAVYRKSWLRACAHRIRALLPAASADDGRRL